MNKFKIGDRVARAKARANWVLPEAGTMLGTVIRIANHRRDGFTVARVRVRWDSGAESVHAAVTLINISLGATK